MSTKQKFIVFIIILLAAILLFPKSKIENLCNQYSGKNKINQPSDSYIACQTDVRCEVDHDSFVTKETDSDVVLFMCKPAETESLSDSTQKTSQLPK